MDLPLQIRLVNELLSFLMLSGLEALGEFPWACLWLINFLSVQVRSVFCLFLQLSSQRRQLLKDKFKGFNTEVDELHRIQEQWSIPDAQLRARIRSDNIEMIVPLYTEFYRM